MVGVALVPAPPPAPAARLPVRRDAQLVLQPVVIGQVLADPAHCVSVVYRRQLCNTHTHITKTNV